MNTQPEISGLTKSQTDKITATDVLKWLDDHQCREAADEFRSAHGLKVPDRCQLCGASPGGYICGEADRLSFACTNYRGD